MSWTYLLTIESIEKLIKFELSKILEYMEKSAIKPGQPRGAGSDRPKKNPQLHPTQAGQEENVSKQP